MAAEHSNCHYQKVLVIDSGVGGLSICQSVLSLRSDIQIIYIADDAAFPYGTKGESFLDERLSFLVAQSFKRYDFDLVVLACNTISTLLLPTLRENFPVPFVGVVPAIKPAAQLTKSGVIGLLATPGTVSRTYTADLIKDFAAGLDVLSVGSRALVEQAEAFLLGGAVNMSVLEQELSELRESEALDVLVLGCTHFPLLRRELAQLLPDVTLVDSGEAIARRVDSLLPRMDALPQVEIEHQVMFTGQATQSEAFRSSLLALGMLSHSISVFPIDD